MATEETPPPARPPAALTGWQTAPSRSTSRGRLLAIATLLLCALTGIIVGLLLLIRPAEQPYLLALAVPVYDRDFPPLEWANQDVATLAAAFPGPTDQARNLTTSRAKFSERLAALARGQLLALDSGPAPLGPNQVFVLHMLAHADAVEGTVYVLPADAARDTPASWVPLEDILAAVRDCGAAQKGIWLDVARPRLNPFTGPLEDTVSPAVDALLNRLAQTGDLPGPVLVAVAPGQDSLTIPSEKRSVFSFYLAEGLQGAADGWGSAAGTPDGRVTFRELAAFTRHRVSRWAKQNRATDQTPVIYDGPDAASVRDFVLESNVQTAAAPASESGEDAPPPPPSPPFDFAPAGTAALWAERQQLAADPERARINAAPLSRFDAAAVLAERLYFTAGAETLAAAATDRARQWLRLAARSTPPSSRLATWTLGPPPRSPDAAPDEPDRAATVRAALDEFARTTEPTLQEAVRAKLQQAATAAGPNTTGAVAWRWLLDNYTDPPWRLLNVVAEIAAADPVTVPEAFALRRMVRADNLSESIAGAAAAMQFLRLEEARALLIADGPQSVGWIRAEFDAADTQAQMAEAALLRADDPASVRAAGQALAVLTNRFAALRDKLRIARQAQQTVADASRLLSATAYSAAEFDRPAVKNWLPLALATTALATETDVVPNPDWRPDDWTARTAEVRRLMAALVPATPPATWDEFLADLGTPLPTDRAKLWADALALAARKHADTRERLDQNEAPSLGALTTVPPTPNARSRRADVSIALLRVAGLPAATRLATLRTQAGADAKGWLTLTQALRQAWTTDFDARRTELAAQARWPELLRLDRVFPAGLSVGNVPADWVSAADRWQSLETRNDHAGLADHLRRVGMLRKNVPGAAEWYERAATTQALAAEISAQ